MTDKRLYSEVPSDQKCCGIPFDRACFVFGVFSLVIRGFDVVYYILYDQEERVWRTASKSLESHLSFGFNLTSLLFSFILCYGAQKRRPDLLMVYLAYGVVMNVLVVVAAIIVCVLTPETTKGLSVLVGCVIYTAVLLLIKRTREVFLAEQSGSSTQPLDPEACKEGKAYSSIEPSVPMKSMDQIHQQHE